MWLRKILQYRCMCTFHCTWSNLRNRLVCLLSPSTDPKSHLNVRLKNRVLRGCWCVSTQHTIKKKRVLQGFFFLISRNLEFRISFLQSLTFYHPSQSSTHNFTRFWCENSDWLYSLTCALCRVHMQSVFPPSNTIWTCWAMIC